MRYVFHDDNRQTGTKVEVQHFISAPVNEIAMNNDIRVCKIVSEELDAAAASVKKHTTKVWLYVFHCDERQAIV